MNLLRLLTRRNVTPTLEEKIQSFDKKADKIMSIFTDARRDLLEVVAEMEDTEKEISEAKGDLTATYEKSMADMTSLETATEQSKAFAMKMADNIGKIVE